VTITSKNQFRSNESIFHIAGKQLIYDWASEEYKDYPLAKLTYEHRVPIETKGNKYRIIDVAVLFPSGQILALECQLSPISLEDLEERFYDYQAEGIDSIWFFGNKANTRTNVDFVTEKHGEYNIIGFTDSGLLPGTKFSYSDEPSISYQESLFISQ